jgi:hypothetical protein
LLCSKDNKRVFLKSTEIKKQDVQQKPMARKLVDSSERLYEPIPVTLAIGNTHQYNTVLKNHRFFLFVNLLDDKSPLTEKVVKCVTFHLPTEKV